MARYLVQVAYTAEALANSLKNPQDARERVQPLFERLGGRIVSVDYALGDYDLIAIVECPDNAGAATAAFAILAGGAAKTYKTTPLLSVEEGMAAMRKAQEVGSAYRPPAAQA